MQTWKNPPKLPQRWFRCACTDWNSTLRGAAYTPSNTLITGSTSVGAGGDNMKVFLHGRFLTADPPACTFVSLSVKSIDNYSCVACIAVYAPPAFIHTVDLESLRSE
eukprot:5652760-Amphidinium_carterae.1